MDWFSQTCPPPNTAFSASFQRLSSQHHSLYRLLGPLSTLLHPVMKDLPCFPPFIITLISDKSRPKTAAVMCVQLQWSQRSPFSFWVTNSFLEQEPKTGPLPHRGEGKARQRDRQAERERLHDRLWFTMAWSYGWKKKRGKDHREKDASRHISEMEESWQVLFNVGETYGERSALGQVNTEVAMETSDTRYDLTIWKEFTGRERGAWDAVPMRRFVYHHH